MIKISVLIASLSLTLSAATFTQRFDKVPKVAASCHEEAATLKNLFAQQTGNTTGFVACTKDDGKVSDYELSYSAEKPLPYATTDVWSVYLTGLYGKLENCQQALSQEVELFESNTGVKKFVAYCKQDFDSMRPRWAPLIFGFGEAIKQYWVTGYSYFSVPYKFDAESFRSQLRTALSKNGAVFAGVVSGSGGVYGTMEIHYYAKERVPFELLELSQSPKIEQCQENLVRLNAALDKVGADRVTAYCGQYPMGAYWELATLFAGKPSATKRVSVESFEKLEICEANRTRLVELYKSSGDSKILDGFCGHADQGFNVVFIRGN